jgi:hypothetical protein
MHLNKWFLGLCLVLLLAGEFFLFQANRQKDAALVKWQEARQDADRARADLDQLKAADTAEIFHLRTENQELPQLRSQVAQLQADKKQLLQQLNTTLTVAQQQQERLRQIAAAQAEAQAEDQTKAERDQCINNLREIEAAKQQWAVDNNKPVTTVPTRQDLQPYFNGEVFPVCPSGGTYTIGAVNVPPACSIPGHVLPPQ